MPVEAMTSVLRQQHIAQASILVVGRHMFDISKDPSSVYIPMNFTTTASRILRKRGLDFSLVSRPTTLQGLFELKAKYNDAKLVVGNTEVGIEMKFKSMAYPHLIGVTHIAELNRIEVRPLWALILNSWG